MKFLTTIAVAALALASVRAQAPTGVIVGTVRDLSDGALPGARVFAQAGDSRQQTVSDSGGRYRFELPPGTYRIEAQLQGFRAAVVECVSVSPAKQVQCDLTLRMTGHVTSFVDYVIPSGGLAEVVPRADVVAHMRVVSSSATELIGDLPGMEHAVVLLTVVKGAQVGIQPGPARLLQMNAGVWLEDGLRLTGQNASYRPGDEFVAVLQRDSKGRLQEFGGPHLTFRVISGRVSLQGAGINGFTNGMALESFLEDLRTQTATGVVAGTVRDSSGGTLPGVRVFAQAGDSRQQTVSDGRGRYRFELPSGSYRVEAQLPGFRDTVVEAVVVSPVKEVQCDLTLRIGILAEVLYVLPGSLAEVAPKADVVAHVRIVRSSVSELVGADSNVIAVAHEVEVLSVVKGTRLGIQRGRALLVQENAGVWVENGQRHTGQHVPYEPGDEFVAILRRDSSGRLHEFVGPYLTFRVASGRVTQQGGPIKGFTNGITLESFLEVLRKLA
jgi:hypothetical protein